MTNIKARGFDNAEQLREHLAELDDHTLADDLTVEGKGIGPREEIAALGNEVAELRQRLASIPGFTDCVLAHTGASRPWQRIAVTIAATFVLGQLFKKLRLGSAGVAAVSFFVTQLGRRF